MKLLFYVLLLGFLWPVESLYSQGYIMVAGGGGEEKGGWSDSPYRWVTEHASNKRIAVISYDTGATEWIPDYFKSLGASAARNFIISSRAAADVPSLYDSLITYSGVFVKGGDQAKYYEYYKGTKTQLALQYIFNHGGVISGTSAGNAIISPIVYTAQIASVDPSTALMFAYSPQITLADDFLKTWPERFIYDSHFIERGRFGRLPSFMASWYKTNHESAIGIGVDDHTALCIDTNRVARVFGTGAVSIISNRDKVHPYFADTEMMRAGDMKITQLLHGCSIDLKSGLITGLKSVTMPPVIQENGNQILYFSGTDYPVDEALRYYVQEAGNKTDVITLITGAIQTRANEVRTKLLEMGAGEVIVLQAIPGKEADQTTKSGIEKAKKLIFIGNDYVVFMNFMKSPGNGSLLDQKIRQPGMISFFAGDNARFAGKTVIQKYSGFGSTSYNGSLEFFPGLKLLNTTVIMPYAFVSSTSYENTVSAVPYSMIRDTLSFGLYLTGNTFAEYNHTGNISWFRNISGSFPFIYLANRSHYADFANQGPYAKSRNIAGFELMDLKFLAVSDTVVVGKNIMSKLEMHPLPELRIFPSPANGHFNVEGLSGLFTLHMIDFSGRTVKSGTFSGKAIISLNDISPGIYLVKVQPKELNRSFAQKIQVVR